ncbi:hypothetical protein CFOL_v3_00352 [Cephalotus follicularis]|uniref:Uncharacterized protein n=1 Tax=Cephalotus follicularis TaxID=3775 RepID=A0A1Q3AMF1_CEPFO|nr:hypothetical protein CFOL_v3_00352 [Cephalotus follicularis]
MHPKMQILSQCQSFCEEDSLLFFATKYIWLARINVSGNVLMAPVRLIKSPRNGRRADTRVLMARYPPLTVNRNDRLRNANALPLIPYLVSKYSYIGLANIYQQNRKLISSCNIEGKII